MNTQFIFASWKQDEDMRISEGKIGIPIGTAWNEGHIIAEAPQKAVWGW